MLVRGRVSFVSSLTPQRNDWRSQRPSPDHFELEARICSITEVTRWLEGIT